MTLADISGWDIGGIALLISLLIQIAPIKINPWSTILRVVGRALNGEVVDLLNEREANSCRYRILRFDDEIRHNQKHTKEHFDQMLEDIDGYERYCYTHPNYKNSKAVHAIANIKNTYSECAQDNTFL